MIAVFTQVPLAPTTTIAPVPTPGGSAVLVTPHVPWSYLLPMLILFVGATARSRRRRVRARQVPAVRRPRGSPS